MKFQLDLACDNAAFTDDGDDSRNDETARILREIAKQLDAGYVKGFAFDLNGNRVGTYVKGFAFDLNGNRVGTYNFIED